jgi:hypothetical protein
MINKIIAFTGIVLIAVGFIVFFADIRITGNSGLGVEAAKFIILGILGGIGSLLIIAGFIGMLRGSMNKQKQNHILTDGIDAEGTVNFVDKNFSILVNHTPIYSIVEYSYTDHSGNPHTRRVTNVNSELVIRKQVVVGSKIRIKYSAENPAESVMFL